jgi:hypothetical protein
MEGVHYALQELHNNRDTSGRSKIRSEIQKPLSPGPDRQPEVVRHIVTVAVGDGRMQEYRAFVIGPDGHVMLRHDLSALDDEAAKQFAQRYVDGHDIEVWQLDRRIAILPHEK